VPGLKWASPSSLPFLSLPHFFPFSSKAKPPRTPPSHRPAASARASRDRPHHRLTRVVFPVSGEHHPWPFFRRLDMPSPSPLPPTTVGHCYHSLWPPLNIIESLPPPPSPSTVFLAEPLPPPPCPTCYPSSRGANGAATITPRLPVGPCHRAAPERYSHGDHAGCARSAVQAGMARLGPCATGPSRRPKAMGHSAAQHCAHGF
jgi:hypothetical protein